MILVDSSVWIDHLRKPEKVLAALLNAGQVACHPFVVGEIACGHLRDRARVLAELTLLPQVPIASHGEALALVESKRLAGWGVGWTGAHLLASTVLAPLAAIWSRDKRLTVAAESLGIRFTARGT